MTDIGITTSHSESKATKYGSHWRFACGGCGFLLGWSLDVDEIDEALADHQSNEATSERAEGPR